jgi:hypothetical protein
MANATWLSIADIVVLAIRYESFVVSHLQQAGVGLRLEKVGGVDTLVEKIGARSGPA